MKTAAPVFDQEIEARFDLLTRWTRAVKHDLGNIIYPSKSLMSRTAEEGESGRRLARDVGELTEMLDDHRNTLGYVKPIDGSDARGAVELASWWNELKAVLRAAVSPPTILEGCRPGAGAAPVSPRGMTMLVLPLLLGLDARLGEHGGGVITLTGEARPGDAGGLRFTLRGVATDPAHGAVPGEAESAIASCARSLAASLGATLEEKLDAEERSITIVW